MLQILLKIPFLRAWETLFAFAVKSWFSLAESSSLSPSVEPFSFETLLGNAALEEACF